MTVPRVVTDYDECRVSEGPELQLQGRGLVPYPEVPGPAPRPEASGEGT